MPLELQPGAFYIGELTPFFIANIQKSELQWQKNYLLSFLFFLLGISGNHVSIGTSQILIIIRNLPLKLVLLTPTYTRRKQDSIGAGNTTRT
jgi:heme/copper-type cytochrome/quinol oxidase subunit 3